MHDLLQKHQNQVTLVHRWHISYILALVSKQIAAVLASKNSVQFLIFFLSHGNQHCLPQ